MSKENAIRNVFVVLFLIFMSLYMAVQAGYYEYRNNKQATLTVEQIQKFEQDVKDGKKVDLEDYLVSESPSRKSKISEFSTNLSNNVEKYVKKAISFTFSSLGNLFHEER